MLLRKINSNFQWTSSISSSIARTMISSLTLIAQRRTDAPYVRKIWIVDWPAFISENTSLIEHIAEARLAALLRINQPVSNGFLLMVLVCLLPI